MSADPRSADPPTALFALKVSRPYYYIVTLWLYLLPTGRHFDLLASGWFWYAYPILSQCASTFSHLVPESLTYAAACRGRTGLLYCTLPLNLLCYLMNDLADVAVRPHRAEPFLLCSGRLPRSLCLCRWMPPTRARAARLSASARDGRGCRRSPRSLHSCSCPSSSPLPTAAAC